VSRLVGSEMCIRDRVKELIVEKRIHHVLFTPLNNYTGKIVRYNLQK
jgi:hypothetical protein